MKQALAFLAIVGLLAVLAAAFIRWAWPPQQEIVIDATPAAHLTAQPAPPVPMLVCIQIMPPLDGTRKGISRA